MDTVAAAIAANRFGLGARPGELATIGSDPRGALRAQLEGPTPQPDPAGLVDGATVLARTQALREAQRRQRRAGATGAAAPGDGGAAQKVGDYQRPLYVAEARARLACAVASDRPFVERLVSFWSNHFAISIEKALLPGLAGPYEREAVRPHVLGHFGDLLRSCVRHPAMLLYLDNAQSVGPGSSAAGAEARRQERRGAAGAGRLLGLNENLAREVLELHTLGVDGGYTQADVTEFARVLTGWSLGGGQGRMREGDPGRFLFRASLHEPGTRHVLGRRYAEGGEAQGLAVLDDLARAPATARHVATKLARHFTADDPPPALVDRLSRAFLESEGHLPGVYRVLVDSPEPWAKPLALYKAPGDYVASAWRALALPLPEGRRALAPLELLGQRTWQPGSPAGWPDRDADWDGPAALLHRAEWAEQVGERVGSRRDAQSLAADVLGGTLGERTRGAIAHADSAAQALALLFASPEFLRR